MQSVEPICQRCCALRVQLSKCRGDRQFVALTEITHVSVVEDLLLSTRDAFTLQPSGGFLTKGLKDLGHVGDRKLVQSTEYSASELLAIVTTDIAGGAQDAWRWRNDDRERANQIGHCIGMERPGSTKRYQGKVTRIIAALHRH